MLRRPILSSTNLGSAVDSPRGLTRKEAATMTGLSPSSFDKARREGLYPSPTLPGGRYDRKLIEHTMDTLSGIGSGRNDNALDEWRSRHGSR